MNKEDCNVYYKLYVMLFLVIIITLNITYQNDTIAAIRAIGVQCNVDYTIDIPEITNQEGE